MSEREHAMIEAQVEAAILYLQDAEAKLARSHHYLRAEALKDSAMLAAAVVADMARDPIAPEF